MSAAEEMTVTNQHKTMHMESNHLTESRDPQLWEMAKRRASFKRHLTTYIIMSLFFWVLWSLTGSYQDEEGLPWPVWPMLGWGIGVAFHYLNAYGSIMDGSVEREYQKLKDQQNNP